MSYNLTGIRQRVLDDKLDDTTFSAAIVDNFINDTQRSIFNQYELPFMEKTFIGNLAEGGSIFTFPADFQMVQSLKVTDPSDNKRDITNMFMPFRMFNEAYPVPEDNTADIPLQWTLHGNKLYFSRPTDQVYTLELYYIKKADTLSDDADVPELPAEFEELLVLGAYIRVLERNEDFDLAAYYKNGPYAEELDKMTQRLGKRHLGGPIIMGQPHRIMRSRSRGRR